MNMRCLLILTLTLAFWPAAASAQNFDYYVFTLSWAPEFCHENPSNHSDECAADAEAKFVVHGLWPNNNDGSDPQNCPAAPYDPSAVPQSLREIMPSNLYPHEWQKHGVCSGMSESEYFQKIAALHQQFVIPIKVTDQDQKIAPSALRKQLAKSNPGWMPSSFSIQDNRNSLVAIRVCMSRSFEPISCPRHGDTRNTPITIRAKP
jgi:ribonuclease T2